MLPGTLLYVYYGKLAGDVAAVAGGAERRARRRLLGGARGSALVATAGGHRPGHRSARRARGDLARGELRTVPRTACRRRHGRRDSTRSAEPLHACRHGPSTRHNRGWSTRPPAGLGEPEPAERYHLVVIGAGTAGLVTAAGAAGLGARVALVERAPDGRRLPERRLRAVEGGDPRGPRLAGGARRAASASARRRRGRRRRLRRGDGAHAPHARRHRAARLAPRASASSASTSSSATGASSAADAVEVGGAPLRFRRAVIATGARAAAPPIDGLEDAGYLTNETVFSLTELPPPPGGHRRRADRLRAGPGLRPPRQPR